MAAKYKLQDFSQVIDRDIFVDANVMMYLFWPTGQHNFENNYAKVFSNLLKQKNRLFIDFLIISEVINRVLRNELQRLQILQRIAPSTKFKDFRNSTDGSQTLDDIYTIFQKTILKYFEVVESSFSKTEIEKYFTLDELDMIDKGIVTTCKKYNFILLTNDKDFKNSDIDILSGNPIILK